MPEKNTTPHAEAHRLLALGFKLCTLHPMSKRPVGDDWQLSHVAVIDPTAGGYGVLLAVNGLCSIDPDNVEPAREGLQRCGFVLEDAMAAGVRTSSTRPGSGGRSTFHIPAEIAARLRWVTFKTKTQGTLLELRAHSSNLQDCLPGTVYRTATGEGPYEQHNANGFTLDKAPELPPAFLIWWLRLSEDVEFLHQQQRLFCGPDVQLAVSSKGGKLAYPSPYRAEFNDLHDVADILEKHNYTRHDSGRWAPPTATGAPCVRAIPGRDGLWQSDHASDPLHGTFDAWTASVVLDYLGYQELAEGDCERQFSAARLEGFTDVSDEDVTAEQRDELARARREHQRTENQRVGDGAYRIPVPDQLTLDGALGRFVFLQDGSRVADIFNPGCDSAFVDWANAYAASTMPVKRPPKELRDGQKKEQPDEDVPISRLWKASPHRKSAFSRTFKAGGGLLLLDPEGRPALNSWRPFDRTTRATDPAGAALFLEHITFLFPEAGGRGRFLDWLAHIEQRPGELPATAWLHIARNFGMGRNWLASVLARVWAGSVAANLDLVGLLRSGFNGVLARKVLAVVDEIREGGRDSQWEHAERLKSLVTEETRHINPKFGRQYVEFNACRFLMFSNHLSAIPMERGDRRIEVVSVDAPPRDAAYYSRLYRALHDPMFIASVAAFLGARDIGEFNPGAHAAQSEAKCAATRASQTPMAEACEMLVAHWPVDIITAADISRVLMGDGVPDTALTAGGRRTLEQFGIVPYPKVVRLQGQDLPARVSILRNRERWTDATSAEVKLEHARRQNPDGLTPRDFLYSLAAG